MELMVDAYEMLLNINKRQTKDEILASVEGVRLKLIELLEAIPVYDRTVKLCESSDAADVDKEIALNLARRLDTCEHKEAAGIARELRPALAAIADAGNDDDEGMASILRLMDGDIDAG